jgi:ABC-type transport system involved in cytochrome c biogenesis permease subunit
MKRIVIVFYIVVVAVLAAATIVEKYLGTEYVSEHIFGAWWFSAMWAVLTAVATFYFIKRKVRRASVVVLHLSFVIILAGALLTHLTAVRGVVPLRKGIATNEYLTRDMYLHKLPFTICLENFEIKFYEGSDMPSDYVSHVTIDGKPFTISMNQIVSQKGVRLYQSDYDMDLQGSILAMNSDPWGIPVTYCGYALLFVSLVWMLIDPKGKFRQQLSILRQQRFPLVIFTGFLLSCFILLLYHFLGKYSAANHPLPVLNSRLLPLHVSTIMMAYTLLLLTFIVSLVGIAMPKQRQKMYHFSQFLLFPALMLLCYGIFIGAIWANVSWGTYWSWDPKETWALITLMIYAAPAHRTFSNLSTMKYHIYMALAFFTILMTYLGVNYFLGGMHSYA